MLFKNRNKFSQIKTHTEFVGSTQDKVIHSTARPCQEFTSMNPNYRWYTRTIPKSGEYVKCPKCFPQPSQSQAQSPITNNNN